MKWILITAIAAGMSSCGRELPVGVNPYEGGREPSKIKFGVLNRKLDPVKSLDTMELKISGLSGVNISEIKVYINESLAELVNRTDSTMRVRLPENVSSGNMKLIVDNQIFFGPMIYVSGFVKVDQNFRTGEGFNSSVGGIFRIGNRDYITGSFTSYNNEAVWGSAWQNRLHILDDNGKSVTNGMGEGANGVVNTVYKLKNEKLLIAGNFSNFKGKDAGGITILQSDGDIDLVEVSLINLDLNDPSKNTDKVSTFNGLLNGNVKNVFLTEDEKSIIAVGNFDKHERFDYKNSTKTSRVRIPTLIRNVARLYLDGRIDSTFQFNNKGISNDGEIRSVIQLPNKKIIIAGAFKRYNLDSVNNIVVLNADGTVDKHLFGSGAKNGSISHMTYNPVLKKIGIVGSFNEFNGHKVNGAIILHEDGSMDPNFRFLDTNNRFPSFIYIMNDGHVVVSGDFEKYDNIYRSNLLILDADGKANQDLNSFGKFRGVVNAVSETKSSEGFPALLIGGSFSSFEDIKANNIVRLEIRVKK